MDIIQKLTNLFSEFPTVGTRTANRFVYYLMKQPKEKIEEITNTILELKQKIKFCDFCQSPHQTEKNLCPICLNYNKNKNLLCIVEKEQDMISIEKTGKYNGLYFILNLNTNLIKNQEINNLKLEKLKQRLINPEKFLENKINFSEIIIATNPTPEGINTSVLIERSIREINLQLNNKDLKITHLARGIPVGGELEYADQETLESAINERK